MRNYYEDFEIVNLMNTYMNIEHHLQILGQLYDGARPEAPSAEQKAALDFHNEGYNLGDQIYSAYSNMGAVLQAMGEFN